MNHSPQPNDTLLQSLFPEPVAGDTRELFARTPEVEPELKQGVMAIDEEIELRINGACKLEEMPDGITALPVAGFIALDSPKYMHARRQMERTEKMTRSKITRSYSLIFALGRAVSRAFG